MTTTELAVDPFEGRIQVGSDANRNHGAPAPFNDVTFGIWTRSHYTWCGTQGPGTGHSCSRPAGHPAHWNHVAASETGYHAGDARVHEIWGAVVPDPAQTVVSDDPFNEVNVGDVVTISDDDDAVIYTADTGLWCCAVNPNGSLGMCSRKAGHDPNWAHIAGDGLNGGPYTVVNKWGGPIPTVEADPIERHFLQRGTWYRDLVGWDDRTYGLWVRANRCDAHSPDRSYVCTRPQGHPGRHLGCTTDQIVWIEDKAELPVAVKNDAVPPDGSPVDPVENVLTAAPEVGDIIKLRDRARRLYVIAARRGTAEIEVLDLESAELWSMPISRGVKLANEGPDGTTDLPTIAELEIVAKWYHDHRNEVRKVAVREYRGGRWCMAGLNEQLAEMGMEQYEPRLTGQIRIEIPFEHEDSAAGRSTIEALVHKALEDPAVVATLLTALPQIENIEMDTSALKIAAVNLGRQ